MKREGGSLKEGRSDVPVWPVFQECRSRNVAIRGICDTFLPQVYLAIISFFPPSHTSHQVFNALRSQIDGKAKFMALTLVGLGLSKCENIILRVAFKKIFSFKTLGKIRGSAT